MRYKRFKVRFLEDFGSTKVEDYYDNVVSVALNKAEETFIMYGEGVGNDYWEATRPLEDFISMEVC